LIIFEAACIDGDRKRFEAVLVDVFFFDSVFNDFEEPLDLFD
jgi:hypothetical protein